MEINKDYPYLVWFATLFIAPFILGIAEFFSDGFNAAVDVLKNTPGIWLLGFIFSSPSFGVYYIIFYKLRNKLSPLKLKLILNIVCIISIWVTFSIIGYLLPEFIIFYSIATIIASFLFRIKRKNGFTNPDVIENL